MKNCFEGNQFNPSQKFLLIGSKQLTINVNFLGDYLNFLYERLTVYFYSKTPAITLSTGQSSSKIIVILLFIRLSFISDMIIMSGV